MPAAPGATSVTRTADREVFPPLGFGATPLSASLRSVSSAVHDLNLSNTSVPAPSGNSGPLTRAQSRSRVLHTPHRPPPSDTHFPQVVHPVVIQSFKPNSFRKYLLCVFTPVAEYHILTVIVIAPCVGSRLTMDLASWLREKKTSIFQPRVLHLALVPHTFCKQPLPPVEVLTCPWECSCKL